MLEPTGQSLGAYAFLWGSKMEATATWFGMFLADGARLGVVDAMTELWSGKPPANRAPTVEPLVIMGEARVDPGEVVRVRAAMDDPGGRVDRVHWVLRRESGEYAAGGDYRPM